MVKMQKYQFDASERRKLLARGLTKDGPAFTLDPKAFLRSQASMLLSRADVMSKDEFRDRGVTLDEIAAATVGFREFSEEGAEEVYKIVKGQMRTGHNSGMQSYLRGHVRDGKSAPRWLIRGRLMRDVGIPGTEETEQVPTELYAVTPDEELIKEYDVTPTTERWRRQTAQRLDYAAALTGPFPGTVTAITSQAIANARREVRLVAQEVERILGKLPAEDRTALRATIDLLADKQTATDETTDSDRAAPPAEPGAAA